MKKFTQKWAIVALLDETAESSRFHYTEFPLHITIAGVFKINHDGIWLASKLKDLIANQRSFHITAQEQIMLGPNENIAATKVKKSSELMGLHAKVHNWLVNSAAVYNEPQYQGRGYLPHITYQKSGKIEKGRTISINSISIIDLFPGEDGHSRKLLKTLNLK